MDMYHGQDRDHGPTAHPTHAAAPDGPRGPWARPRGVPGLASWPVGRGREPGEPGQGGGVGGQGGRGRGGRAD